MTRADRNSVNLLVSGDLVRSSKIIFMMTSLCGRVGRVNTSSSALCFGVRRRRTSSWMEETEQTEKFIATENNKITTTVASFINPSCEN